MSDILDPTVQPMDETAFYRDGNRGGYVLVNSHQIEVTRGELHGSHGLIEQLMFGELINAGWESINVTMWRRENMPGWYTMRRAWQIMNEETKTNE